jgi:hypothetical protein
VGISDVAAAYRFSYAIATTYSIFLVGGRGCAAGEVSPKPRVVCLSAPLPPPGSVTAAGGVRGKGDLRMSMRLTRVTTCVATFVALAATPTTRADFTPVHMPPGGEADHLSIFEAFYSPGTAWHASGSRTDAEGNVVDLTNGSLVATRVHDWGFGGVLDAQSLFFGEVDDQSWTGGELTVTAVARYAGYTQEFGYDLDGDELGYVQLFDLSGNQMGVSGAGTLELGPGDTLAWMRDGNHGGRWSSRIADNSDDRDHMVTYSVSGMDDGLARWMLFWEDLPGGGDLDYNDLAVEVTAPIPEPGTGATVVLACGVLVSLRRRRAL